MKVRYFFLLLLWALPQSALCAPVALYDFLEPFIESGEFFYPPHFPPEDPAIRELTKSELPSFIKIYERKLPLRAYRWRAQPIPKLAQVPTEHPVGPFYNTHILWALEPGKDTPTAGFLPTDTTTGCSTGCTPVVFHLQIDSRAKAIALITEPDRPLRKINHAILGADELAKALEMARNLPEGLKLIETPSQLTNAQSGFPPQTWTTLKPLLIPGAAYTSFRIFEVALAADAVVRAKPDFDKLQDQQDTHYGSIFRISNEVDAVDFLNKKLKEPLWDSHTLSTLPWILWWLAESDYSALSPLVVSVFSRPEYKSTRLFDYCTFLQRLTGVDKAAKLLALTLENNSLPACPDELKDQVLLLTGDKATAKSWNFGAAPQWVLRNPKLLRKYAELSKARELRLYEKWIAEIFIRHPAFARVKGIAAPSGEFLKDASASYKEELSRDFLAQPIKLPAFSVLNQRNESLPFKPSAGKPEILFFYASWCSHCQATLKLWASSLDPTLFRRVRLVEVFPRSLEWSDSICTMAQMEASMCKTRQRFDESNPNNLAFGKSINLNTVPRILLLGADGKIIDASMRINSDSKETLRRDLEWILEEAAKAPKVLPK